MRTARPLSFRLARAATIAIWVPIVLSVFVTCSISIPTTRGSMQLSLDQATVRASDFRRAPATWRVKATPRTFRAVDLWPDVDRVWNGWRNAVRSLSVPVWPIGLAAIGLTWWLGYVPRGGCRICRYDVRQTPDRCPECGTLSPASPRRAAPAHAVRRPIPRRLTSRACLVTLSVITLVMVLSAFLNPSITWYGPHGGRTLYLFCGQLVYETYLFEEDLPGPDVSIRPDIWWIEPDFRLFLLDPTVSVGGETAVIECPLWPAAAALVGVVWWRRRARARDAGDTEPGETLRSGVSG